MDFDAPRGEIALRRVAKRKCRGNIHACSISISKSLYPHLSSPPRIGSGEWRLEYRFGRQRNGDKSYDVPCMVGAEAEAHSHRYKKEEEKEFAREASMTRAGALTVHGNEVESGWRACSCPLMQGPAPGGHKTEWKKTWGEHSGGGRCR